MRSHLCARQAPLADQEGPSAGSMSTFELMSSKDLAYQMTMFDWELFSCMHEVTGTRTHTHTHSNPTQTSTDAALLRLLLSARAAVPHVRAAELPQDDGQPGPVPAQVQPGAAVGGDRGVSVRAAQQESAAPQEVHQDRGAVSGRRRRRRHATRDKHTTGGCFQLALCVRPQLPGVQELEFLLCHHYGDEQPGGQQAEPDVGGKTS